MPSASPGQRGRRRAGGEPGEDGPGEVARAGALPEDRAMNTGLHRTDSVHAVVRPIAALFGRLPAIGEGAFRLASPASRAGIVVLSLTFTQATHAYIGPGLGAGAQSRSHWAGSGSSCSCCSPRSGIPSSACSGAGGRRRPLLCARTMNRTPIPKPRTTPGTDASARLDPRPASVRRDHGKRPAVPAEASDAK